MSIKHLRCTNRARRAVRVVPRPALPAVTCTPWCSSSDGHTDASCKADQTCISDVPGDTITIGGNDQLGVYLLRAGNDRSTTKVRINATRDDDQFAEVEMSKAEARLFAQGILDTCAAEADPTGPRTCIDCGVTFAWNESSDDDRCAHCADVNEWRQGGAAS